MRLDRLLNEVDVFDRPADARRIDVTLITDNTAEVVPGSLFCCVKGTHRDGHDLIPEAVAKGAVAVLVERDMATPVPHVRVSDVRASLAPMAAAFYDNPSRHMRVTGITGTNGKTTTTHLLAAILRRHQWKTATIGTLTGQYTTPPAVQLQRTIAELRAQRNHALVMEVSSAGLAQRRVDAIRFDVGIFTNLSQDHLDEHGTMGRYFEAKSMLFDPGRTEHAVVNVDDEYGRKLIERLAIPVTTFSLGQAEQLEVGASGSTFRWEGVEISLPLIGRFNVSNALAAATAARLQGVPLEQIAAAISSVEPVPGRTERVDRGQPFTVLVDFAHTPDGLESLLTSVQDVRPDGGRVIVVFGAGGDRDPGKRPLMGAVVDRLADLSVVTNDNPRSEDPGAIAEQILDGMTHRDRVLVELDRHRAIERAIGEARPGDVVVIAGKGHEATQEVAGTKHAFDDRAVAASVLDAIAAGGGAR